MGTFVAILGRGSLANPQKKQCSESPREQKTTLKQHFCMYCGKLKTCLARHLQKVLSDEDQVRNLVCLKGREKQKALRSIRLLGDKEYNEKVEPHKRIAVRKPVLQLISESLHCPVCNALIARKNFSKHHLKCSKRAPDYRKRIRQIENEITSKTSLDFDEKLLKQLLVCKMTK
jgi:translation initiation factor IF-3